jgi:hypothetical protein
MTTRVARPDPGARSAPLRVHDATAAKEPRRQGASKTGSFARSAARGSTRRSITDVCTHETRRLSGVAGPEDSAASAESACARARRRRRGCRACRAGGRPAAERPAPVRPRADCPASRDHNGFALHGHRHLARLRKAAAAARLAPVGTPPAAPVSRPRPRPARGRRGCPAPASSRAARERTRRAHRATGTRPSHAADDATAPGFPNGSGRAG